MSHASLLELLHLAPVGVMRAEPGGQITVMNPAASRLLVSLMAALNDFNLYTLMEPLLPELADVVDGHDGKVGVIRHWQRLELPGGGGVAGVPESLSITALRLPSDPSGVVLVVSAPNDPWTP